MPKRPQRKVGAVAHESWIQRQVSLGNLLSIGTIFVTVTGFYFTTNNNFEAQAKAIAAIERKLSDNEKKEDRKDNALTSDRDVLRKEVNELGKTTAVLSSQLTTTNAELMKLGQKIDTLLPASPRR